MQDDPKVDVDELRIEHVLAALDQISLLSAQVRQAIAGLDPKMVLDRSQLRGPLAHFSLAYSPGGCDKKPFVIDPELEGKVPHPEPTE